VALFRPFNDAFKSTSIYIFVREKMHHQVTLISAKKKRMNSLCTLSGGKRGEVLAHFYNPSVESIISSLDNSILFEE
jgi:hypothetical protein